MTKEEIINKNFTAVELDFFGDRQGSLLKAMDEYASQQAIAFLEWAIDNEKIEPLGYESSSVRMAPKETAQSAYNQFIEQQNKE